MLVSGNLSRRSTIENCKKESKPFIYSFVTQFLAYFLPVFTMLRAASRFGRVASTPRLATRTFSAKPTIIYTETDEAPNLATYSLLPIVKKMVSIAGIDVVKSDISLSGRIICQFPELLTEEQRIDDELTKLGMCSYQ